MTRCSALLLLLLLLWAGVPGCLLLWAESWSGQSDNVTSAWWVCRSAVESPIQSAQTKLEARVEKAEKKLKTRVKSAERKLEARVESAETKLEDRVESAQKQLEARVESAETKLEACVESAQKQLETRMDGIQSEQAAQTLELTGRLGQIASALQGVQSQLESRLDEVQSQQRLARDCSDLAAGATSGVHLLQPGLRSTVAAYCDQNKDGGGWTIIQRRADVKPRQDFFLGWAAYKWGFGELDTEFWWGLENLWLTTSLLDRRYQLRIDMEDFDGGKRYAVYQGFKVASEEDGYRLTVANYTGNAGDSLKVHYDQRFSTKDQDQDTWDRSCAEKYKGGWWYRSCHDSNLNGLYLSGNISTSIAVGVIWQHWRGNQYSLKSVEMKIKPSKKL